MALIVFLQMEEHKIPMQTAQVFDILLGDNLAGRKEHIAQHGAEYLDDLDVS